MGLILALATFLALIWIGSGVRRVAQGLTELNETLRRQPPSGV